MIWDFLVICAATALVFWACSNGSAFLVALLEPMRTPGRVVSLVVLLPLLALPFGIGVLAFVVGRPDYGTLTALKMATVFTAVSIFAVGLVLSLFLAVYLAGFAVYRWIAEVIAPSWPADPAVGVERGEVAGTDIEDAQRRLLR